MPGKRISSVMGLKKLLKTSPETSVTKAVKIMAMKHVGAILIMDGQLLLGIFTERDLMVRVVARGRDPETTKVGDVMTPSPKTTSPDELYDHARATMQRHGFRHLPVVENGATVGIVSSRSAPAPDLHLAQGGEDPKPIS